MQHVNAMHNTIMHLVQNKKVCDSLQFHFAMIIIFSRVLCCKFCKHSFIDCLINSEPVNLPSNSAGPTPTIMIEIGRDAAYKDKEKTQLNLKQCSYLTSITID